MKKKKYEVNFLIGSEEVCAFNEEQATILAQAKRIEKGQLYQDVLGVVELPSFETTEVM